MMKISTRVAHQFNVDFGNKSLSGSLNIRNIQPVNINASISGNSFSGAASSSSLPSAARVEGKFYGVQAKELAGLAQAMTIAGLLHSAHKNNN